MKSAKKQQWTALMPWIIGIIAACVIVLFPLLRPGFFVTDDGDWMIIRLTAFTSALGDGQIPARFLPRLNHNYGYPVANFLYPGFLYVGSIIHTLGIPYVATVKLILGGSVVVAALSIFFWLRVFFPLIPSFVGTLGYIFAPYLLFDLYVRGSVGEVFAMASVAVMLVSIARGQKLLLPLATAALIVGHNTLALFFFPFLAAYVLWKKRSLVMPLFLGVFLASFFWLPVVFERGYVLFDSVVVAKPWEYFLKAEQWWLINPVASIAAVMILSAKKQKEKGVWFGAVVFVLLTLATTSIAGVLWNIDLLGRLIQFPYRILSVTTFFGSFLIASFVSSKHVRAPLVILSMMLWLIPIARIIPSIVYTTHPEGYYTTNEATTTVADEYLPRWMSVRPQKRAEAKAEFVVGRGTVVSTEITGKRVRVEAVAQEDSTIQINTVYYPGWGVQVDGRPSTLSYDNPMGVMRVDVPAGLHMVDVEFRETALRLAADIISVIAFIAYGYLVASRVVARKKI